MHEGLQSSILLRAGGLRSARLEKAAWESHALLLATEVRAPVAALLPTLLVVRGAA
jgi:hypothetical protein